jgi:hypothetical protein
LVQQAQQAAQEAEEMNPQQQQQQQQQRQQQQPTPPDSEGSPSHDPSIPWPSPAALTDPLFQDLDRTSRYYLAHCKSWL